MISGGARRRRYAERRELEGIPSGSLCVWGTNEQQANNRLLPECIDWIACTFFGCRGDVTRAQTLCHGNTYKIKSDRIVRLLRRLSNVFLLDGLASSVGAKMRPAVGPRIFQLQETF